MFSHTETLSKQHVRFVKNGDSYLIRTMNHKRSGNGESNERIRSEKIDIRA